MWDGNTVGITGKANGNGNKLKAKGGAAIAAAIAGAVAFIGAKPALADLNWDPGHTGPTTGASGGSGTWNAGTGNWYNANTMLDGPWDNTGAGAIFGTTTAAATVTVVSPNATPLTATGLTFNTNNYTLSSSTSGNTLMLSGATPTINVNGSAVTATIGTVVASTATNNLTLGGSNGLTVSGGGTLQLANAITLTGGITVNSSTLAEGVPGQTAGLVSFTFLNGNNLTLNNSTFIVNSTNSPFTTPQSIGNVTVSGNSTISMNRGNSSGGGASSSIAINNALIVQAGTTLTFSMGGFTCTNGALVQFSSTTLNGDATFIDYEDPTKNASGTTFTGGNAPVGENGRLGIYNDNGHNAMFLSGGSSTLAGTSVRLSSAQASPMSATGNWTIGSNSVSTPRGVAVDLNTTSGSTGGLTTGSITVNPYSQLWLDGVGLLTWGSASQTIHISGIGTTAAGNAATAQWSTNGTQPGGGALALTSTTTSQNGTANTLLSNVAMDAASSISTHVNTTNEIDGNITGTGPLTLVGGGTLNLGGTANSWTGGTIINNGTVVVNAGSSLSSSVGPLTMASSTGPTFGGGTTNITTSTGLTLNVNQTVGSLSASFQASSGTASNSIKINGVNLNIIQTVNGSFSPGAVPTLSSTIADGTVAGGSISLDAASTATLTFNGANTYTGGTVLHAGTLLVNNPSGSGTGSGPVTVDAAATLGGGGTIAGTVNVNGGTLLPGTNVGGAHLAGTFTLGGLNLNGGTLDFNLNTPGSSDQIKLGSGNVTFGTNPVTINLTNLGALGAGTYPLITYSGTESPAFSSLSVGTAPGGFTFALHDDPGSVDLVVTPPPALTWAVGDGNWDQTAPNWSGASTTYTNGTSVIFNDSNTGGSTINVTVDPVNGVLPGVVTFANNSKNYTVSGGAIGGNTTMVVSGTGTVTLMSPNTFTGVVAVSGGGTLSISADNQLGNATNPVSLTSASPAQLSTLDVTTSFTSARSMTLYSAGGAVDVHSGITFTVSGAVAGTGGLAKTDAGTLVLTSNSNSYGGSTTVSGGTLRLGAAGAIPAFTALTVGTGATLDAQTFVNSVGSLSGAGAVTVGTGGALTAGFDNSSTAFSGTITGAGSFGKAGSGTLTLSGSGNNFSGGFPIFGGGTVVGGSGALGTGLITLSDGSTLQLTASPYAFGSGNPTLAASAGGGKLVLQASANITLPTLGGSGVLTISGGGSTVTTTSTLAGTNFGGVNVGTSTDGGDTLVIGNTDTNGNIGITNTNTSGPGTVTLASGSTFYQNATITNPKFGVQIGFKSPSTSSPAGTLGTPAALNGANATGNGTLTLNNNTTWKASGFTAYSGGSPTVARGASITVEVDSTSDTLIDNTAWRATTTGDTSAVINVTGGGTYQIASGAITTAMYAGKWDINMASTGKFVIAQIPGGTGETLNALGYNGSTGAGWNAATNPITLDGGTIVFGADAINPGDSTPPPNLNSYRSTITVTGVTSPGAIAPTGFEYSNTTTGNTGAIFTTTPVTPNIAGDMILQSTLTVDTFDPLHPTAGPRNINFNTNGTGVQGNFTWAANMIVDGGGTTGGQLSFGRTQGTVSVFGTPTLTVNAGSTVNVGFIPGKTGVSGGPISGIDPLTDSSSPSSSVAVIANGNIVWGGRTSLAGDAGAGTKTYSVASLMIGGSATAQLAVPDQIGDLTILNTGPLTIAAGGKLDLTKNEATITEPLSMLRSQIHDGLVTTSTSGLAVGSLDLGGGVDEARATLLGDSDLDGKVNVADLANLAGNFGVTSGATWLGGDFDYNDNVNVADLADLAGNFGKDLVGAGFGGGTAAAGASSLTAEAAIPAAAAVPEPSAMLISALATMLLTTRRRRRHLKAV
jgi:autotransporter-associated beta strand protein